MPSTTLCELAPASRIQQCIAFLHSPDSPASLSAANQASPNPSDECCAQPHLQRSPPHHRGVEDRAASLAACRSSPPGPAAAAAAARPGLAHIQPDRTPPGSSIPCFSISHLVCGDPAGRAPRQRRRRGRRCGATETPCGSSQRATHWRQRAMPGPRRRCRAGSGCACRCRRRSEATTRCRTTVKGTGRGA